MKPKVDCYNTHRVAIIKTYCIESHNATNDIKNGNAQFDADFDLIQNTYVNTQIIHKQFYVTSINPRLIETFA